MDLLGYLQAPEALEATPWAMLGALPMMAGAAKLADGHGDDHGHDHHEEDGGGIGAAIVTLLLALPVLGGIVAAGLGGPPEELLGLIVLVPLLGALVNGLLGSKLPRVSVNLLACLAIVTSFVLSAAAVWALAGTNDGQSNYTPLVHDVYTWFKSGGLDVSMRFVLDPLSAVMIMVITGVGSLIHLYSTSYMSHDPGYARYFTYLNLFCGAMLILVLGASIPITFIGWEGVGMCSYLLIGFWFTDDAKASAGKKAFIVNRVGDFAFVLAMVILFFQTGTLDYSAMAAQASQPGTAAAIAGVSTVVGILLFIGCTGKSAQIPLYVWLPDAMAGPTPVSALIHAATMVTAGVYLIARMNWLFVFSPTAMWTVAIVGGLTALMAASIGMVQNDIKGVLAYSTVSQLGYMFMAVGVGAYTAGVFHLMTHAFFKALLFLGSGSVIHGMHEEQDIRKMGGLAKLMPITNITFLIGCIAIAGVPGLSGFFSKDEILWHVFANVHPDSPMVGLHTAVWIVGVLTAGMTAFYMFRLYFVTFTGECRADDEVKEKIHESPWPMTVPLIVLAVLSVVGGYVGFPKVFGALPHYLHGWLDQVFAPAEAVLTSRYAGDIDAEHTWEYITMAVSVVVAFAGIGAAYFFYVVNNDAVKNIAEKAAPVHKVLLGKYYIDELYHWTVIKPAQLTGQVLHKLVDEVFIDLLMVNGPAWMMGAFGGAMKHLQSGNVQRYAAYILMGLCAILYLMLFR